MIISCVGEASGTGIISVEVGEFGLSLFGIVFTDG